MAPAKSFERRYANRETNPRTFTFVRNWKNIASESQPVQETGAIDQNGQAIISPLPKILNDSDLSTSDIVNQSPVPIIVSHIANQSEHLQEEQEDNPDDVEEDEDDAECEYDDPPHVVDIGSPGKKPKTISSEVVSSQRKTKTNSDKNFSQTCSPLRESLSIQNQTKRSTKKQVSEMADNDTNISMTTSKNSSVIIKEKSSNASTSSSSSELRKPSADQEEVIANASSSLWKAKRVTARCARKNIANPTSSAISNNTESPIGLVTSTPLVPVRKPNVTKTTIHQNQKKASTRNEANSKSVSLLDDGDSVRCASDVLDLDVILECIKETEEEVIVNAESQTSVKAVKKVFDVTRKELRKTISQVHQIKLNQAQLVKKQSSVKRLRRDLCETQQRKTRLKSKLTGLRKKCNVDKDLLVINRWLFDFSKFQKHWFNNPATQE